MTRTSGLGRVGMRRSRGSELRIIAVAASRAGRSCKEPGEFLLLCAQLAWQVLAQCGPVLVEDLEQMNDGGVAKQFGRGLGVALVKHGTVLADVQRNALAPPALPVLPLQTLADKAVQGELQV